MKNCLPAAITGAAATGLALAVYTILVEHQISNTPGYRPLCDIGGASNCSVLLMSPYSRLLLAMDLVGKDSMLNVSNAHIRAAYFAIMMTYPMGRAYAEDFYLVLSVVALVMAGVLGYILLFILKDACVLSISSFAAALIITVCLACEQMWELDSKPGKNTSPQNDMNRRLRFEGKTPVGRTRQGQRVGSMSREPVCMFD